MSKRILVFLLCATTVGTIGCTTTTQGTGQSQNVKGAYIVGNREEVLESTFTTDDSDIDRKKKVRRCKVVRTLHASMMIYANPGFIPVYVADHLKRRKASQ